MIPVRMIPTRSLYINGIGHFIRRRSDLPKDDIWSCVHIDEVAEHLVPTVPNDSKITVGFCEILVRDFRNYETHLESVDHIPRDPRIFRVLA